MVIDLLSCSQEQFEKFFAGMPELEPCDECESKWREQMEKYDPDCLMSEEEYADHFGYPHFRPDCPTCMKQYTEAAGQWAVRREEMSLLRSKGIKQATDSGRA